MRMTFQYNDIEFDDHLPNPQELDIEFVKEVDIENESDASEAIAKERESNEQFSAGRVTPRTKK